MVKLILPTYAAFKEDVETVFGLLEKTAGKKYEIGLEIVGKPEHFSQPEHLEKITENINSIAQGAHIIVHGFSGIDVYENGNSDMRTDKGVGLLLKYLQLAQSVNASYVHVHSSAGYQNKIFVHERMRGLSDIKFNLLRVQDKVDPKIKIGIENLPYPSMGDVETDPKKVWRDCVDSLAACQQIVEGTELKTTFDTCHFAADKKGKIDLVKAVEQYLEESLYHLHVNDVSGFWVPKGPTSKGSTFKEGVIPGDGRIGEQAFQDFFAYIRKRHPDISICAEVQNTDYKKLAEAQESIRRIMRWLG